MLFQVLGMKPISWLNGRFSAKMAVMILELWKGGTFFVFVYMSAMRSLPADCLESSRIDGANVVQETIYVVLATYQKCDHSVCDHEYDLAVPDI